MPQEPSYVPASEPKFLRMFVDIYLVVKAKRKACGQGRCCKIPRGCPQLLTLAPAADQAQPATADAPAGPVPRRLTRRARPRSILRATLHCC